MKNAKRTEVKPKRLSTEKPEYRFDYGKARPNRFAGRVSPKSVVVLLDPDVAKVFKNAEAVNSALRALLAAIPH